MSDHHIKVLDTTLRDGQQCPGAAMSFDKNLAYARLAIDVGIDVIEVGFASASDLDFDIVHTIAKENASSAHQSKFSSLCQLREAQIVRTIEALLPAQAFNKARLHTYLPVDPNLMEASLGKYAADKSKLIDSVHNLIKIAAEEGMEVEFSPEGYSRLGNTFDFVTDVIHAAIEGGATVINCPDTIGGACRLEGEDYFVENMRRHRDLMRQAFPDKEITWSAHCHNDFGLALDNSMNAVFSGVATQVEGCINGIGERAGNLALEQAIMYIKHFGQYFDPENPLHTQINTQKLQQISDFVNDNMLPRQPHWPITGDNSARHTSGGHINAILNNPLAYQPFDPAEVGNEISFVFGPLSGGNHCKSVIEKFGYRCDDSEKATIAQFIKTFYQERRKGITDEELLIGYREYRNPIKARDFSYTKSSKGSSLTIEGDFFDKPDQLTVDYEGQDSALAALHQRIVEYLPVKIENYYSKAIGKGIDAKSQTTIVISTENNQYTGISIDQDIEISALKALIEAVNEAYIEENFKQE